MKRAPGVLLCLITIAATDMSLRLLGFGRTLRVARFFGGRRQGDAAEAVRGTLKNVIMATAFYPGRSKCLEQAVASYVLLRRMGVPVQIRLGVQPYPFYAHAWLEMDGKPLTESEEVIARFALLPDPAI